MLQSIHDRIQGWVAGIIALIIALTFALWGVQNYLRGDTHRIVSKVNGEEITQEQLRVAYEQAKRGEILRSGKNALFDQKSQARLKQEVLQQLVKHQVILQAVTNMGLEIGRQQLWDYVSSVPAFKIDGHFSRARFQQLVGGLFYSEQSFFDDLKSSFLQVQLEKGIKNSAFVLPSEVELVKNIFKQKRDFSYFTISPERFSKTVQITQDSIQKYYEQHQNDFLLPEQLSIQYLELSLGKLDAVAKPKETEFRQFYQTHLDSFSTPKKWQAIRVLLPLSSNTTAKVIADAKQKINEIAIQAKDGKDLSNLSGMQVTTSWLSRSEMPPDFVANLDRLAIGQVSIPLRTKDGYNLFKISAIQPAKFMPYKEVAGKVKEAYERQHLAQVFSKFSDRLADLVYTNSDSLEPAAKELGLKIQETDLFTRVGNKSGILTNPKVSSAAFSDAVLKQHYNSNLIELGSGRLVVLRIKNHIPERVQPLNQVSAVISQKLRQQQLNKMMVNFAELLLAELRSGKHAQELRQKYGLAWDTKIGVSRAQDVQGDKLAETAFTLNRPQAQNIAATVVALNGGYAVLRLDRVYNDHVYPITGKDSNFLQSLPELLGAFDYQGLLDSFMRQAKIKIIEKFEIS